jgi:small GTP-binding protein
MIRKSEAYQDSKVVLVGDICAGKTSILTQFYSHVFNTETDGTIGAEFVSKDVHTSIGDITLYIWDTAGQDQFQNVTHLYCRDACGAMIVFDLSSVPSFVDVEKWVDVLHSTDPTIPFILVGNKMDLNRAVSEDQIENVQAKLGGVKFLQTSAKTGDFVQEAFQNLVEIACERRSTPSVQDKIESERTVEIDPGAEKKDQPVEPQQCC